VKHRTHAFTRNALAREQAEYLIAGQVIPEPVHRPATKVHRHGPFCNFGEDCKTREEIKPVATVNFCEKHSCEAMGKNTAMGTVVIIPANATDAERIYADAVHTTGRNTIRMELCPGCIGELMEWIEAAPVGPRTKYTKPWEKAPKVTQTDVERVLAEMGSQDLMRLALERSDKEAGL
jgi:hypothetical protein